MSIDQQALRTTVAAGAASTPVARANHFKNFLGSPALTAARLPFPFLWNDPTERFCTALDRGSMNLAARILKSGRVLPYLDASRIQQALSAFAAELDVFSIKFILANPRSNGDVLITPKMLLAAARKGSISIFTAFHAGASESERAAIDNDAGLRSGALEAAAKNGWPALMKALVACGLCTTDDMLAFASMQSVNGASNYLHPEILKIFLDDAVKSNSFELIAVLQAHMLCSAEDAAGALARLSSGPQRDAPAAKPTG